MTAELYTVLAAIAPTYDSELPATAADGASPWVLTVPVIVVSEISHVPEAICLDSRIALTSQRLTLEVQALTLAAARTLRASLKTALHGWHGGTVKMCSWELDGPTLIESDTLPPRYVLPVDFMLTF